MPKKNKFKNVIMNIRKNLITGLITALPLYITISLFMWLMKFFHKRLNFIPKNLYPDIKYLSGLFELILFIIIIIVIYLIGVMTNHYLGKKLIKLGDNFLNKIPLIRTIYMGIKQILSSFVITNKKPFRKVVLIEYPRKGIKSLAFLTGEISIIKKGRKKQFYLSVFLPSTPNPTTGYFLLLPKKDVKILKMSPENAIKFIISGGVLGKEIKIEEK